MIRLRDRIQIVNPAPGSDNPLGNPTGGTIDWDTAVIEPAEMEPMTVNTEIQAGRDVALNRYRLVLCPVTAVTSRSLIKWHDDIWQVNGGVERYPDIRGNVHHHMCVLERWSG